MDRRTEILLRGLKMLRAIYETTDKQYAEADEIFNKIRHNDIKEVNKLIKELEVEQHEKRKSI